MPHASLNALIVTSISSVLHIAATPFRWGFSQVRRAIRESGWRISHDSTYHRGISLHVHFMAPEQSDCAMIRALDRIAEVDPISFANIPRLLPGGVIADATNYSAAWYSISRKACVIGETSLRLDVTDDLALSIIHELCHARLWERGIGYDNHDLRLRVEKVCVRREIAFARKLEALDVDPGFYTLWLQEKLKEVEQTDYSETSFRSRHRRVYLERLHLLRQLNTPRWLRRLVVLKARRRLQALRARSHRS